MQKVFFPHRGGKNTNMVQIAQSGTNLITGTLLRPGRKPGPSRAFSYLERALAGRLGPTHEPPIGAFTTLPRHDRRESAVRFEPVDLAVLIDILPVERHALPGLPGVTRPLGPVHAAVDRTHLLS